MRTEYLELTDEKSASCKQRMQHFLISPQSVYKILWDICIAVVYFFCFIFDPLVLCFKFEPLRDEQLNMLLRSLTVIIILDILTKPFIQFEKLAPSKSF